MNYVIKSIFTLLILVISGCATTSETPLSKNVWQLESKGGKFAGSQGTKDALLKRAAELTLEKGYTHFKIKTMNSGSKTRHIGNTPIYGNSSSYGYGNTNYSFRGGEPIFATSHKSIAIVEMYISSRGNALNATKILEMLKPKKKLKLATKK